VIVNDLNIACLTIGEAKTDPPLVVDAYAVLPGPVALQRFKPVSRRHAQVGDDPGVINHPQLAPGDSSAYFKPPAACQAA